MKCKMTERSKQIFGNDIAPGAYKKAVRSKQKFIRKFGDDSTKNYPTSIKANPYIGPELGVSDIRVGEEGAADFHTEKGIIVGNIRMGFGHYRISMAIASAAHALPPFPYEKDFFGSPFPKGGKKSALPIFGKKSNKEKSNGRTRKRN